MLLGRASLRRRARGAVPRFPSAAHGGPLPGAASAGLLPVLIGLLVLLVVIASQCVVTGVAHGAERAPVALGAGSGELGSDAVEVLAAGPGAGGHVASSVPAGADACSAVPVGVTGGAVVALLVLRPLRDRRPPHPDAPLAWSARPLLWRTAAPVALRI